MDALCNTSFSDPPDEEIKLFEYCVGMKSVKTLSISQICIVYKKTGWSLNINKNEMEQYLGIHRTMKAHDDPDYDKLLKVRPFVDRIKSSL